MDFVMVAVGVGFIGLALVLRVLNRQVAFRKCNESLEMKQHLRKIGLADSA